MEREDPPKGIIIIISASLLLIDELLLLLAEIKEEGKRWYHILSEEPVSDQSMMFSSSLRIMKGKTSKRETISLCPLRCMHGMIWT